MTPREYLQTLLRTEEEIQAFVDPAMHDDTKVNNSGWTFSAELGWVLKDGVREGGFDATAPGTRQRSRTFYHYHPDGARRMINAAEAPCRIHSYGDSFTHCDQVSDGETWQEYLAAHLQEPIANYGVGGYGVYQAYLRMLKVEAATPAEYVIFNIFQDDHYRSLDAWRSIRFGQKTPCGYTLPHLRVDPAGGEVTEHPNICQSAEDLMRLTDLDWVEETFADDPVLGVVLGTRSAAVGEDTWVPMGFGLTQAAASNDEAIARLTDSHTHAALLSTCWILDRIEEFTAETGKKVLIVLSYGPGGIRPVLAGKDRFDQLVVDHLAGKSFPVVDLRDAHAADFADFSADADSYLQRFFIGHYSPAGNFFEANAIAPALIQMLEPKPLPYSR